MNSPRHTHEPLDPAQIFQDIVRDEDFETNKQKEPSPRIAFSVTALALVDLGTSSNGERTRSCDQLHVAATICDYVRTIGVLDNTDSNLESDIRKKLVRDRVMFNHALEALVGNDPNTTYPELFKFTHRLYRQLFRADTPERNAIVANSLEKTLNGIRGEIVGEQLAQHLGYPVEGVTVEDDMHGIDRYLGFENNWYGVDFKADPARAMQARMKRPHHMILTVPVERDIIGTSFYYSPDDLDKYANKFEQELGLEWLRYSDYHTKNRLSNQRKSHISNDKKPTYPTRGSRRR